MRKLTLLSLLIPIFFVQSALAESTATVKVNNNVNSSSTSNSEVKSHTEITVETNGEVTRYESDEPGSVSVKSINGQSEIKVNGETVSGTPQNISATPTRNLSQTPSPTPIELTDEQKENLNQIEEILEDLKEKITSLQKSLSSLFD